MSEEEDEGCWSKLEHYRVKLISVIDPNRITPYLRQCRVLNSDDEEQVFNDPSLVIRKRKVGKWPFCGKGAGDTFYLSSSSTLLQFTFLSISPLPFNLLYILPSEPAAIFLPKFTSFCFLFFFLPLVSCGFPSFLSLS